MKTQLFVILQLVLTFTGITGFGRSFVIPPIDPIPYEYHWLEAECGYVGYAGEQKSDHDASRGGYVWAPKGSGRNLKHPGGHIADYSFKINHAIGEYFLWARVKTSSSKYNSIFFQVSHGCDI